MYTKNQPGGTPFARGQQGFEMTTDRITADSKNLSYLDLEQEREDLLAMARIMHH